MTPWLRTLAALLLAGAPIAAQAQNLLHTEKRLDLKDLAREGDRFGWSVAVSREIPCVGQPESLCQILVVGAAQAGTKGTESGAVHVFNLKNGAWERDVSFSETAPDTTTFDAYGYSVAISGDGNVIAVGAPLHDGPKGNAGAVYVWSRPDLNSRWSPEPIELRDGLNADLNDHLGTSVALSNGGKILVAGAPQPNPVPDPSTGPSGKAYVFKHNDDGSWEQSSALTAELDSFAFFGFDVAVNADGTVAVVGAPGADKQQQTAPLLDSGAVYRFTLESGAWVRTPLALGTRQGDELGISVAVSDDGLTVVAGAREKGANQSRKGSVYVFQFQSQSQVKASALSLDENTLQFGTSVAVSGAGDTVVAGAPGSLDPNVNEPNGEVHFFQRTGAAWTAGHKSASLSGCEGQRNPSFGQSVALGGASGVVGIPLEMTADRADAGSVCALDLTGVGITFPEFPAEATPGEQLAFDIKVTNENTSVEVSGTVTVTFDETKLLNVKLKCTEGGDVCSCKEGDGCSPEVGSHTALLAGGGRVSANVIKLTSQEPVVFRFTALVKPDASGKLDFTIELSGLSGLDVTPVEPKDLVLVPKANLALLKDVKCVTDGQCTTEVSNTKACSRSPRGKCLLYTITVTNSGPSDASQVTAKDPFNPEAISAAKWKCAEMTKGARCGKNSGSGDIRDAKAFLPVGGELLYTAAVQIRADTEVRELTNRADVTSSAKEVQPNNNHDEVETILPRADLRVRVFPAPKEVVPRFGAVLSAEIRFINDGEDAVGVVGEELAHIVVKIGPPNATWTCSQGSSGVGQLLEIYVAQPAHSMIVCIVKSAIGPADRGEIQLIQEAKIISPPEVLDLNPDNNVILMANLRVTKLTPSSPLTVTVPEDDSAIPGDPVPHEYTISIINGGPSHLLGATVKISFPLSLTAVAWSCEPKTLCGGSGSGNIHDRITLPAGETLTYNIRILIDSAAVEPIQVDVVVKPDDAEDQTVSPKQTFTTNLTPIADLAVSDHKGPKVVIPGSPLPATYTFRVFNAGPSDIRLAKVTHQFKPTLSAVTWTCASTNGSCPVSGQGKVSATMSLRVGGSATFTVRGTAGAELTGKLQAKATVTVIQENAKDPRPGNNSLSAPEILLTPVTDLAVVSLDGPDVVIPGNPLPVTYKFTVTNAGPSDSRVARVTHDFMPPLDAVTWTCAATNGSCPQGGQGNVAADVSLRVGGTAKFTVKGVAGASLTGELRIETKVETKVSADPREENNKLERQARFAPVADLAITKTFDGTDAANPLYKITVVNTGPSDVVGAVVLDQPPTIANVDGWEAGASWTCAALNGSCSCLATGLCGLQPVGDIDCEKPDGSASVLKDTISLRVGGRITYTLPATAVTAETNVACVSIPLDKGSDPKPENNLDEASVP